MAVPGFYFDASMWQPVGVTEKKNPLGPIGERVQWNVERLRTARGLTKADLSARTKEAGRQIPPLGISRIEAGTRRVDADDLVVLAVALNVEPNSLLLPPVADDEPVDLAPDRRVTARTAWAWALGYRTAMDVWFGDGVNLAAPGVDGTISTEAYEKIQEYQHQQDEFESQSGPARMRRARRHQAMRLAEDLVNIVSGLVAPEPGVDRLEMLKRSRLARSRVTRLTVELDAIDEQMGVSPTDEAES